MYLYKIGTYDRLPYFCSKIKLALEVSERIVKCCSAQCDSWKTEREEGSGRRGYPGKSRGSARLRMWYLRGIRLHNKRHKSCINHLLKSPKMKKVWTANRFCKEKSSSQSNSVSTGTN